MSKRRLILLIDFGSTYTKLTAVDLDREIIAAQAKAPTTVTTHIMNGLNEALDILDKELKSQEPGYEFVEKLACSSAAGGLRMDVIGLVPKLTAQAAKMAALNAGAKLIGCYSYELGSDDISRIIADRTDIILLAGGTDGGNKEVILHNAKMLAESSINIPIIVAGNRTCGENVNKILTSAGKEVIVTENVMPSVNELNIEPVRRQIREIFIKRIIQAKGINEAATFVDKIMMPTPTAVLNGAQLLAKGANEESGMGDLAVIDIGGATTDVHSIAEGAPTKPGVVPKGLPEPYAKRTVEGDMGIRWNARSIVEEAGLKKFAGGIGLDPDFVDRRISLIANDTKILAITEDEKKIDFYLAYQAARISMKRHTGYMEQHYTVSGIVYSMHGKDLSKVEHIIGTGGPLVHSPVPAQVLQAVVFNPLEPEILRPQSPKFYLDSMYILYACGLLNESRPDLALRIMKRYLKQVS